jgi:hypothetical protein
VENNSNGKTGDSPETRNPEKENQPLVDGRGVTQNINPDEMEKDLNSRILEITLTIQNNYPELSKFIEEMPVTIPVEADQQITINHLKSYYESLVSMLARYKLDHPANEQQC